MSSHVRLRYIHLDAHSSDYSHLDYTSEAGESIGVECEWQKTRTWRKQPTKGGFNRIWKSEMCWRLEIHDNKRDVKDKRIAQLWVSTRAIADWNKQVVRIFVSEWWARYHVRVEEWHWYECYYAVSRQTVFSSAIDTPRASLARCKIFTFSLGYGDKEMHWIAVTDAGTLSWYGRSFGSGSYQHGWTNNLVTR